ncbi:MAG: TrmH family RNA methyltransferase, partial [Planctomycetota bacterium]
QAVFAATARHRHKRPRLSPSAASEKIRSLLAQGRKVALVFGPEDHGLSSEEVDACDQMIGIPAHPDLTSYNLAQAVLLVCYTLFTHSNGDLAEEKSDAVLATHEDRQRIESQALDLLKAVDYLTENRAEALVDMVRRLVFRADLETRDVRNILAIIRHLNFKLNAK